MPPAAVAEAAASARAIHAARRRHQGVIVKFTVAPEQATGYPASASDISNALKPGSDEVPDDDSAGTIKMKSLLIAAQIDGIQEKGNSADDGVWAELLGRPEERANKPSKAARRARRLFKDSQGHGARTEARRRLAKRPTVQINRAYLHWAKDQAVTDSTGVAIDPSTDRDDTAPAAIPSTQTKEFALGEARDGGPAAMQERAARRQAKRDGALVGTLDAAEVTPILAAVRNGWNTRKENGDADGWGWRQTPDAKRLLTKQRQALFGSFSPETGTILVTVGASQHNNVQRVLVRGLVSAESVPVPASKEQQQQQLDATMAAVLAAEREQASVEQAHSQLEAPKVVVADPTNPSAATKQMKEQAKHRHKIMVAQQARTEKAKTAQTILRYKFERQAAVRFKVTVRPCLTDPLDRVRAKHAREMAALKVEMQGLTPSALQKRAHTALRSSSSGQEEYDGTLVDDALDSSHPSDSLVALILSVEGAEFAKRSMAEDRANGTERGPDGVEKSEQAESAPDPEPALAAGGPLPLNMGELIVERVDRAGGSSEDSTHSVGWDFPLQVRCTVMLGMAGAVRRERQQRYSLDIQRWRQAKKEANAGGAPLMPSPRMSLRTASTGHWDVVHNYNGSWPPPMSADKFWQEQGRDATRQSRAAMEAEARARKMRDEETMRKAQLQRVAAERARLQAQVARGMGLLPPGMMGTEDSDGCDSRNGDSGSYWAWRQTAGGTRVLRAQRRQIEATYTSAPQRILCELRRNEVVVATGWCFDKDYAGNLILQYTGVSTTSRALGGGGGDSSEADAEVENDSSNLPKSDSAHVYTVAKQSTLTNSFAPDSPRVANLRKGDTVHAIQFEPCSRDIVSVARLRASAARQRKLAKDSLKAELAGENSSEHALIAMHTAEKMERQAARLEKRLRQSGEWDAVAVKEMVDDDVVRTE